MCSKRINKKINLSLTNPIRNNGVNQPRSYIESVTYKIEIKEVLKTINVYNTSKRIFTCMNFLFIFQLDIYQNNLNTFFEKVLCKKKFL